MGYEMQFFMCLRIFYVIGMFIVALVVFQRILFVGMVVKYQRKKTVKKQCPITGLTYRTVELVLKQDSETYRKDFAREKYLNLILSIKAKKDDLSMLTSLEGYISTEIDSKRLRFIPSA